MNGADHVIRILAIPLIAVLWVVWKGPYLAWAHLYPALKARRKHRLIWIPWFAVVTYFVFDTVVHRLARQPDADAVIRSLERVRVAIMRFLDATVFAGPRRLWELSGEDPLTGPLLIIALSAVLAFGLSFTLLAPLFIYLGPRGKQPTADSHGTAHWGTPQRAESSGMLFPKDHVGGLMLGRFFQKVPKKLDPRLRTTRHVLTAAPTRSGKGVGCVIPHLLEYPGSIFCLDLKGENAAVTASRRQQLGDDVAVIDPFGVTRFETKSVNWIDWLDMDSPDCVSEAAALADMLIVRGGEHESHWDDAALTLLQGLLLHVGSLPEAERHPGTLRELLTLPEPELLALFEDLADDKETGHGIVARMANTMLQKADRERSGVLSTAHRHTAFLDDPRIIDSLKRSEVNFDRLKTDRLTVYLVMPPDKLRSQARYVRAVIYMALRGVLRVEGRPDAFVTFLLDEVAQLGRMSAIEDAVSLVAGYGAWLWLLVQDLSQLKAVYPKWETFLANTTLQAFGTQDQYTARYLSEALGTETILVETEQQSRSAPEDFMRSGSSSQGTALAHHGRPLMMPDEIRRLSEGQVIVLQQGEPPYHLQRLDYLTDPELAGTADDNPMYAKVASSSK